MSSNNPAPSQNPSTSSTPDFSSLPRGLLGRKGVPIARGARLPSLRSPRDLTLGGATKRTFTPNIPARREKRDDEVKSASGVDPSTDRGRRGRRTPGERGRGRGRGNNLIQLSGSVFGEGIAAEIGKKRGSFGQSTRDESSSKSVPVPKYIPNSKGQTKEEKEEEEAKLNDLLKDDFVDDWDEDASRMLPVQLPLLVKEVKQEEKDDDKEDDKLQVKIKRKAVKLDPLTDDEDEQMDVDDVKPKIKPEIDLKPEIKVEDTLRPSSAAKLFTNSSLPESGQLLFLQFPDCLPGISGKKDIDVRTKKEPSTKGTEASVSQVEENQNCVLADLPEGFIGKLQVHRSGRTRLLLGSVCLNVELGTPLGFLQDLVSVRVNETRDPPSGDMFVLGHVQEKLVCLPDMESLLKNLELK